MTFIALLSKSYDHCLGRNPATKARATPRQKMEEKAFTDFLLQKKGEISRPADQTKFSFSLSGKNNNTHSSSQIQQMVIIIETAYPAILFRCLCTQSLFFPLFFAKSRGKAFLSASIFLLWQNEASTRQSSGCENATLLLCVTWLRRVETKRVTGYHVRGDDDKIYRRTSLYFYYNRTLH